MRVRLQHIFTATVCVVNQYPLRLFPVCYAKSAMTKERLINSGFYDLATAYQSVHVNY